MSCAGLIVAQIFISVFTYPHPYEMSTPVVENRQTLVRGLTDSTSVEWISFLLSEGVDFSIANNGSTVQIATQPIPILEKAKEVPSLQTDAERALVERRIEERVSGLWPEVRNAQICLVPTGTTGDAVTPSEGAIFVVVPNFPQQEREGLFEVIEEFAGSVDRERISILGSVNREEQSLGTVLTNNPAVSLAQR